jgi:hypothetical protein
LAAAGKYLAAIAAEMTRSEATIRTHAALLHLTLAKGQRGPKAQGEMKPGPRPKKSKGIWYVSFEPKQRLPGERAITRHETFRNEQDAKAFAKAKLTDCTNINAGTLNPYQPKQVVTSAQIYDWLNEPDD